MEILEYVKDNPIEVFTLITGLVYVILEVSQKNMMWILGILTSSSTVYMFYMQGLYASSVLNVYYLVIAFWGLYQWRKDSRKLHEISLAGDGSGSSADRSRSQRGVPDRIHLGRLSRKVVWGSVAVFVAGTFAVYFIMDAVGDSMSVMDAAVTMLSAVATWWLGRSYLQQWLLWIAANILTFVMCLSQGMFLMSVLYVAYTCFAVYGYFHWRRYGCYV